MSCMPSPSTFTASTMSTMAPTTAAVVIAFFRSAAAREIAEFTSCWLTTPSCLLMVFDIAEYQSSGVVRSLLSDCPDLVEDRGHTYGADLSEQDKKDLIEFLKTL